MKVKILVLVMIIMTGLTSCYEDVFDTYDDSVVYKLRDRGPAGGWIFYINPNYREDGWRYLEAAPEDQDGGTGVEWATAVFDENGDNNTIPPELTGIGDGKKNTDWIKENHKLNLSAYPAFKACIDYRGGGYSDWFLPSKDELKEMCWNLRGLDYDYSTPSILQNPDLPVGGVGGFVDDNYWSSTEFDINPNTAWYQVFMIPTSSMDSGKQIAAGKQSFMYRVRAIRAF